MNFGSKNVLASVILSSITNASAEYMCPNILYNCSRSVMDHAESFKQITYAWTSGK